MLMSLEEKPLISMGKDGRMLRASYKLTVNKFRLESRLALTARGGKFQNGLPVRVVEARILICFKKKLDKLIGSAPCKIITPKLKKG